LESRFFGLRSEDKEALILEPSFILMYYCGFTFRETYCLPIAYKRWFIQRINKELSRGQEEGQSRSRALHDNPADARALLGMNRAESPSRLRRFT
jgi:hypothetical protein